MPPTPDPLAPWRRLGAAVIARRVELGHTTRESFARHAKLTPKTLGEIERGVRTSYDKATLATIERALNWPVGHVQKLLDGPQITDPDEVARTVRRDDFVLVWLLTNAALTPADLLRVEMLIRQRREAWEREHLWPEVAARIAEMGGVVSWPWDDGGGDA